MNLSVVIIEPRPWIDKINFLIQNVRGILGDIPIQIYCGASSQDRINKDSNTIIRSVGKDNLTRVEYCDLAKSVSFWERIDTDKILFMQTDGCLCKKSQYKVEDFYKYDYVGGYAPQAWWSKELRIANIDKNEFPYQCLNGGFSLRTTEACKKVIETFTPRKSIEYTNYNKQTRMENIFEDLFFVCGMHLLGYNVGRDKFATNFCTHTEYVSNTFCVHNLFKYKRVNSFLEYCPEYDYIR
jgi:hypothetical protein